MNRSLLPSDSQRPKRCGGDDRSGDELMTTKDGGGGGGDEMMMTSADGDGDGVVIELVLALEPLQQQLSVVPILSDVV